jgi:hypothetical protein
MGLTLEKFAERLGFKSKGLASELERTEVASLRVALAIEELSGGRIDAAGLCEEVRLARAAVHASPDTAADAGASSGKSDALTAAQQSEAA